MTKKTSISATEDLHRLFDKRMGEMEVSLATINAILKALDKKVGIQNGRVAKTEGEVAGLKQIHAVVEAVAKEREKQEESWIENYKSPIITGIVIGGTMIFLSYIWNLITATQ